MELIRSGFQDQAEGEFSAWAIRYQGMPEKVTIDKIGACFKSLLIDPHAPLLPIPAFKLNDQRAA